MCTPPRGNQLSPPHQGPTPRRNKRRATPASVRGSCRWIDASGLEWHFHRTPEALIVSRPNSRGEVAIRFADMVDDEIASGALETWVRVETGDGRVIRCGLSSPGRDGSAVRGSGHPANAGYDNRFVESWLDTPRPACKLDGSR